MAPELQRRKPPQQNKRRTSRWRRPAQVSSIAAALGLTLAFPSLGTPVLAALAVVAVWVESKGK